MGRDVWRSLDSNDDPKRFFRYVELQARTVKAMPYLMPGAASPAAVEEFQLIANALGDLIRGGPFPADTPRLQDLELQRADALENIARAHESLREVTPAVQAYEEAGREYERLGKAEFADRCRRKKDDLVRSESGDVDAELEGLRQEIKKLKKGSAKRAEALLALGELSGRVGDNHQSVEHLLEAYDEFEACGLACPSDADILGSLFGTLQAIENLQATDVAEQPVVGSVRARGLYKRWLLSLTQALRETHSDLAEKFESLLALMERQAPGTDFNQEIRKLVKELRKRRRKK